MGGPRTGSHLCWWLLSDGRCQWKRMSHYLPFESCFVLEQRNKALSICSISLVNLKIKIKQEQKTKESNRYYPSQRDPKSAPHSPEGFKYFKDPLPWEAKTGGLEVLGHPGLLHSLRQEGWGFQGTLGFIASAGWELTAQSLCQPPRLIS